PAGASQWHRAARSPRPARGKGCHSRFAASAPRRAARSARRQPSRYLMSSGEPPGRRSACPETVAGGLGRWINRSAFGSDDVVFAQGLALCDAFVTERRKIEAHIAACGEPFGNNAPDRRRVLQHVAAEAVGQE